MDLSAFDTLEAANAGRWMVLTHPVTMKPLGTGDKAPALLLAGIDSDVYQNAMTDFLRRQAEEAIETGTQSGVASAKKKLGNSAASSENRLDLLVAATLDVRNIEIEGKPVTAAPDQIRAMYKRFRWLREQAEVFIANRANFMPGSSTA